MRKMGNLGGAKKNCKCKEKVDMLISYMILLMKYSMLRKQSIPKKTTIWVTLTLLTL
jgi:hypothetical protein